MFPAKRVFLHLTLQTLLVSTWQNLTQSNCFFGAPPKITICTSSLNTSHLLFFISRIIEGEIHTSTRWHCKYRHVWSLTCACTWKVCIVDGLSHPIIVSQFPSACAYLRGSKKWCLHDFDIEFDFHGCCQRSWFHVFRTRIFGSSFKFFFF